MLQRRSLQSRSRPDIFTITIIRGQRARNNWCCCEICRKVNEVNEAELLTQEYFSGHCRCLLYNDYDTKFNVVLVKNVRIVSQNVPGQGYVEVLEESKPDIWQRLCVKNWKNTEKEVICRNLGYSGAEDLDLPVVTAQDDVANYHPIHGNFYCNRNENVSSCCFEKLTATENKCTMMAFVACK